MSLTKVPCDEAPKGYDSYKSIRLSSDTAEKYLRLKTIINDAGGLLLSAGGVRSLGARVGKGRSKTSMHYLGRAFDLPPYAGAFDPGRDPYVVIGDDSTWEVLFRGGEGDECIEAVALGTAKSFDGTVKTAGVYGSFVSFTKAARGVGFDSIGPRGSFANGHYGSMEWWHFEDREGLEVGTLFLDELEKVHGAGSAEKLPHWRAVKGARWDGSAFR